MGSLSRTAYSCKLWAVPSYIRQVIAEERALSARYSEYTEYKAKVKKVRYLPNAAQCLAKCLRDRVLEANGIMAC